MISHCGSRNIPIVCVTGGTEFLITYTCLAWSPISNHPSRGWNILNDSCLGSEYDPRKICLIGSWGCTITKLLFMEKSVYHSYLPINLASIIYHQNQNSQPYPDRVFLLILSLYTGAWVPCRTQEVGTMCPHKISFKRSSAVCDKCVCSSFWSTLLCNVLKYSGNCMADLWYYCKERHIF